MEISKTLFDVAVKAEKKKKFRFVEQLNGAAMSISNNIAEGSGSPSNKEFARYLSIARSSLFEVVNILHIYGQQNILNQEERLGLYPQLLKLSKMLSKLRTTLT